MNNQSIYTESAPLQARKDLVEWLDGCGAVWWINRSKFSSRKDISPDDCIAFCDGDNTFTTRIDEYFTRIPDPEEFCRQVARILGLEKPVFGSDTNVVTKDIKGMAIDVNLLGEDEREWLYVIDTGILSDWSKWTYCSYCPQGEVNLCEKSYIERLGITITESPAEFLKYVAQQTGKEYKKEWGQTHGNPRTSQPVSESYKFKTYRILDSLDGIPLDKRIPLSEWIPPFGKKVLLITKDWFMDGYFDRVESKIIFETVKGSKASSLDGHWMRIV